MTSDSIEITELYIRNLDRYTIDQLRMKPSDDVWSIGQMYAHVIDAADEYIDCVEACAKDTFEQPQGKTEDGIAAFRERLWPDVRVKLEEPVNAVPNPGSKAQLVAGLERLLSRLHAWEERLDSINPACKVRHGWFGWLNAREWFDLVGMHGRNHLRQQARLDELLRE